MFVDRDTTTPLFQPSRQPFPASQFLRPIYDPAPIDPRHRAGAQLRTARTSGQTVSTDTSPRHPSRRSTASRQSHSTRAFSRRRTLNAPRRTATDMWTTPSTLLGSERGLSEPIGERWKDNGHSSKSVERLSSSCHGFRREWASCGALAWRVPNTVILFYICVSMSEGRCLTMPAANEDYR